MNTKELREKSLNIAHEARKVIEDIAADGSNAAEKEAEFDRMMVESDALAKRAEKMELVEARERDFSQIVTSVPSASVTVEARGVEKATDHFQAYLRGQISETELRQAGDKQQVAVSADGGFTVPTTMLADLIKAMKAYGPMNDGGPVRYLSTASGNPIVMPTFNDTANKGHIIAEGAAADNTKVQFGQITMGNYKFTSDVFTVSTELLQDSNQPVDKIINEVMAERLGRILNEKFTVGNGTNEPQGIVTAATVGKTSASASAIAFAELIDLEHAVDPAYRSNAAYMFHDTTLQALRKITDSTGRPLWQPAYTVGAPDTINNRAYYINQDVPVIATGAKSVLFGDFSKFTVRRVNSLALRRLNELFAVSDQVGFLAFLRADSKLLDARAIAALKQA